MSEQISQQLLALGMFSALGTIERVHSAPIVRRREPLTYDANNSTVVVYDEQGRPWICSGRSAIAEKVFNLALERGCKRGAYVPHSNDGGEFVREVMPEL